MSQICVETRVAAEEEQHLLFSEMFENESVKGSASLTLAAPAERQLFSEGEGTE